MSLRASTTGNSVTYWLHWICINDNSNLLGETVELVHVIYRFAEGMHRSISAEGGCDPMNSQNESKATALVRTGQRNGRGECWSLLLAVVGSLVLVSAAKTADNGVPDLGANASLHGAQLFPANNPWNQRIDTAPVDANSSAIISRIATARLHPDFGANYNGGPFGIPYRVVSGSQANVQIGPILYADESDPGPY